jgi:hypothetical protein
MGGASCRLAAGADPFAGVGPHFEWGPIYHFCTVEGTMPETHKYVAETALQGYPKPTNDKDVLKDDRNKLLEIYKDPVKCAEKDAIKYLELGKACSALLPHVKEKVINTCGKADGKVYKVLDSYGKWIKKPKLPGTETAKGGVELGDMTFMMGPLKKVPRILQKAVGYAVCDKKDQADPKLERVVDILRGTLIFENEELLLFQPDDFKGCIGSQLIDAFNDEFGGQLVQVKNRFMNRRQPVLHSFTTQNFTKALNTPSNHTIIEDDLEEEMENAGLVNTIATMANLELSGRDTFYRDLQLLIKLPIKNFANKGVASPLTHVFFELQITTRRLYAAKSIKADEDDPNSKTGHELYNQIRRVMEYCEYLYWTWKKKRDDSDFKYKMSEELLTEFFTTPVPADFTEFEEALTTMWEQYQQYSPKGKKLDAIRNAIDNSTWYKNRK